MVRFTTDTVFKALMALSALVATGSVAYYFLIVMPAVQQKQLELDAQIQAASVTKPKGDPEGLRSCLKVAANNYNIRWANECTGMQQPENCELPPEVAYTIHTLNKSEVDLCFRQFE